MQTTSSSSNATNDDVTSSRKQSSRSKRNSSGNNGNSNRSKSKNNRLPMTSTSDVTLSAESENTQLTVTSPLAVTSVGIMAGPREPAVPGLAVRVGEESVADEPLSISPTGSSSEKSGTSVDIASLMTPSALVIDVVCGLNRAKLCVDGLRNGSKTPCISMHVTPGEENKESWLTPNQFQHASGRGTARDWKRSIKHHGTSLKALLSSKTLTIEPPFCRCPVCSGAVSVNSLNTNDGDVKSDLPLNLSTSSDSDGPTPEQLAAVTAATAAAAAAEHVDQSDSEDEETLLRKHELMSSLSLSVVHQISIQSPKSDVDAMTSSLLKCTSTSPALSADWDWTQLTYGSDRKRAKREETGSQKSDRNGGISGGHQTVARGSTSLFEFVVMTSFTDAYAKYRLQRKRKDPPEEDEQGGMTCKSSVQNESGEMLTGGNVDSDRNASDTTGRGASVALSETSSSRLNSASLTHIIHELRDCKKRLVGSNPSTCRTSNNVPCQHNTSDVINCTGSRLISVDAATLDSSRRGKMVTSKELPDLVRSSLPGHASSSKHNSVIESTPITITKTTKMVVSSMSDADKFQTLSSVSHLKHAAVVPVIPAEFSFPVDHCGAIDLSAATARRLVMSLMAGLGAGTRQPWVATLSTPTIGDKSDGACWSSISEGDVLDLSCKTPVSNGGFVTRPAAASALPRSASGLASNIVDKRKEKEQRRRRTGEKKSFRTSSSNDPLSMSGLQPSKQAPMTSQGITVLDGRATIDVDSPLRWGVRDVIEFVSEVPGCQVYAETFKRFGVRGSSLPVLTIDHMTGILRMDSDAAKSLRLAIDRMMTSCAGSSVADLSVTTATPIQVDTVS